jgi:hypothetical protein
VEGPLRTIITSLLLEQTADRDTRREAENVLRAVGFSGGYSDLELCQFDVELLTDWFKIRNFVTPQVLARRLVSHWIEDLFSGMPTTYDGIGSSSNKQPSSGGSGTSLDTTKSLHTFFGSSPGSASYGPRSPPTSSKGLHSSGNNNPTPSSRDMHRRLSNSFLRFIPFCLGSRKSHRDREEESDEEDLELRQIGMGVGMNMMRDGEEGMGESNVQVC